MKFGFFNLMPWPHYPEPPRTYPTPNRDYDPQVGRQLYHDYIDLLVHAEACGFDMALCNEHHFSPYGTMANCNLIGSILARETRTITLGMVGNLLPLSNPVRVAEEYAMIDVMSGGRLIAGFMRGVPHEYVAYNSPPGESRSRQKEAAELILKCWQEPEPFGWEGEHYQFRSISIWPRPIQSPPRVLMSASNEESAVFAAQSRAIMAMGLISDMKLARANVDTYRRTANDHGWDPLDEEIMMGASTCICETDEEAHEVFASALDYFHGTLMKPTYDALKLVLQAGYFNKQQAGASYDSRLDKVAAKKTIQQMIDAGSIFCGSPESVVQQIKRFKHELGCGGINMSMQIGNLPIATVRKGMDLFRDRVLPHVRDL
ncbi:LLM class flavin-dependent oxidoreductase [Sphingomonas turrisvirgatae]|uniref:Methylene-tetrahydromethanopterin reductase n=1 Tax=Sphingomonas turrisvirgatae TaxID=1888892 RepID=A0A1E3LX63_9SPHN|nr:LLM class flavin-dependent oxidoreductase [Sphingomonas turrisvirgatae]ODP37745.1 methylene-tetrahydromethanopterin reductase [Sphingomonas turrisvirgatae]